MARMYIAGGKVYQETDTRMVIVGGRVLQETTVVAAPSGLPAGSLALLGVGICVMLGVSIALLGVGI